MSRMKRIALIWLGLAISAIAALPLVKLEAGDAIELTVRGIPPGEQQGMNGSYTVDDQGGVRLPLLDAPLKAGGLTAREFARAAERAYRKAGIYTAPAIEVVAKGQIEKEGAMISVGGHVTRDGRYPFQKGMTVLQAIDGAGGRNEFASRNIKLFRKGKCVCLDFNELSHKNIKLEPGDSLQVEQRPALIDRWKGSPEAVAPYL